MIQSTSFQKQSTTALCHSGLFSVAFSSECSFRKFIATLKWVLVRRIGWKNNKGKYSVKILQGYRFLLLWSWMQTGSVPEKFPTTRRLPKHPHSLDLTDKHEVWQLGCNIILRKSFSYGCRPTMLNRIHHNNIQQNSYSLYPYFLSVNFKISASLTQ